MRSKPIWLKSIISGLVFAVFLLLIFFVVYILNFLYGSIILGVICGVIIAMVTACDTAKRTFIARIMGIVAAFIALWVLIRMGILNIILLHILRNDSFVQETGRLSAHHTTGYFFGFIFLCAGMIVSFIIASFVIYLLRRSK